MKRLWSLAALIAIFPTMLAWLFLTGDTQRFLEFLPMFGAGTILGTFAIVTLYREGKDTTTK